MVLVTRDRSSSLRATLQRVTALPSSPPVIVVDNGSVDETVAMVRTEFPDVSLIPLATNRGTAARNLGVAITSTEFVAFADDDSWWEADALEQAAGLFDASERLGLVAARVLVGPERRLDPTCVAMEYSELGFDSHGNRRVLGFIACGAVVRREAFRQANGFDELLFFLGEEETLALDLAAIGWDLVYAPAVVAVHYPGSVERDRGFRNRRHVRNRLLSSVLHRSWGSVAQDFGAALGEALRDPYARAGFGEAMGLMLRAIARRRPVPPSLEESRRILEGRSRRRKAGLVRVGGGNPPSPPSEAGET